MNISKSNLEEKKYIIVSTRFDGISATSVPLSGQIAIDDKEIAYKIYNWLNNWSLNQLDQQGKYTIAVSLYERNNKGTYDAIER